jgi:myb proto-oncogene protein
MCERRGWSEAEDKFIAEKVKLNEKLPEKDRLKWGDIADELNKLYPGVNRSGKQCRERWHNQLDPSISHNEWTEE